MMLTLINTNRMTPPIAPVGLDYVAGAVRDAGFDVDVIDLCLADEGDDFLKQYFSSRQPQLVGLSFRNVDDCFWPSAQSFLPILLGDVQAIRQWTDAPIVLGGVGYSVFPRQILDLCGAEFGIHGDGEQAMVQLLAELSGSQRWDRVPGLLYRLGDSLHSNSPSWPLSLSVPTDRGFIDNESYFRQGGQLGVETKRGCGRPCTYCIDPLAKGRRHRLRDPATVADEVVSLAARGIDVLHLCDAEFNLPIRHAEAICDEFIRRRIGRRVRWYAYLSVLPFTETLAKKMARSGCVGINFTSDAANEAMLAAYRQPHRREHLHEAVQKCRKHRMAVMLDMLLGGPGETPESVQDTILEFKRIDPDCAGASLGIRIYPGTHLEAVFDDAESPEVHPGLRRRYDGPLDLLQPTFFLSPHLGSHPARLVRELIDGDPRFFPPQDEVPSGQSGDDHNYSDNRDLVQAIARGGQGAYWHILQNRTDR